MKTFIFKIVVLNMVLARFVLKCFLFLVILRDANNDETLDR